MNQDDTYTVRTPTRSEINTFKVLANQDFTDLGRQEPEHRPELIERPPDLEYRELDPPPPVEQETVVDPILHSNDDYEARQHQYIYDNHHKDEVDYRNDDQQKDYRPNDERLNDERPKENVHEKARQESDVDVNIEKEALLYEIELMEKQGQIKLHRTLTMHNSLDEIQYQYDRANMIISTQQTVDWAKTGIKMGSSVLEALLKRFGLNVVDGFSNNLCKDMSKFNKPLTKMYRKYWRRGTSSPEMELAMIVFGALAMTVIGNKGFMGGSKSTSEPMARPVPPSVPPSIQHNESAMRPPGSSSNAPSVPKEIPEWARAALEKTDSKPQHYSKHAPAEFSTEKSKAVTSSMDRLSERPMDRVPERPMDRVPERPMDRVPERPVEPQTIMEPHKEPERPERPIERVPEKPKEQELLSELPSLGEPSQENVKKLTLTSPRSGRRSRLAKDQPELNLDGY